MKKKTVFNIVFRDDYGDWEMTLITTEAKTADDIASLIECYDEVNARNLSSYSPVDIMDDIVDANPGWQWCDFEFDINISR